MEEWHHECLKIRTQDSAYHKERFVEGRSIFVLVGLNVRSVAVGILYVF